jgi:NMT1-like family
LNTQGNGIAISNKHTGKGFGLDLAQSGAADYIKQMKQTGTPFKAAYTFPKVNQDFWIRYWLAAGGLNPDVDLDLFSRRSWKPSSGAITPKTAKKWCAFWPSANTSTSHRIFTRPLRQ